MRRRARPAGRRRRVRGCCSTRATPAATTPTPTGWCVPDAPAHAGDHGVRAVRRHRRPSTSTRSPRPASSCSAATPAPARRPCSTRSASPSTATCRASAAPPSSSAATTPPTGVAPRVVLEASLAGRRFRFTRSPQWQRPKKRGTGLTTQQAHVLVEEPSSAPTGPAGAASPTGSTRPVTWSPTCSGMTLGPVQPGGAAPPGPVRHVPARQSSEDRHKVLTQLFRTRRFEDVERWLADRRTTLRRAGERHHDAVAGLLHRVSETTGAELPADWDVADLAAPARRRRRRAWTASLAGACRRAGRRHRDDAGRRGPGSPRRDRGPRRRAPRPRPPASGTPRRSRTSGTRRHRRPGRRTTVARWSGPAGPRWCSPLARVADRAAAAPRVAPAPTRPAPCAGGRRCWRSSRTASTRQGSPTVPATPPSAPPSPAASSPAPASSPRPPTGLTARRAAPPPPRRRARPGPRTWPPPSPAGSAALDRAGGDPARAGRPAPAVPRRAGRAGPAGRVRRHGRGARVRRSPTRPARSTSDATRRSLLKDQLLDLREARLSGMAAELAAAIAVGQDCPVCGSARPSAPGVACVRRSDQGRRAVAPAPGRRRRGRPGAGRRPDARLPGPARARPRGRRSRHRRAGRRPRADAARVRVAAAEASAASLARLEPELTALDAEARAVDAGAGPARRRSPGRRRAAGRGRPRPSTALTSRARRPARRTRRLPRRGDPAPRAGRHRAGRRRATPWSSRSAPTPTRRRRRGCGRGGGRAGLRRRRRRAGRRARRRGDRHRRGRAARPRRRRSGGRGRPARRRRPRRGGRRGARPAGPAWRRATTPPSRTPPPARRTRPPSGVANGWPPAPRHCVEALAAWAPVHADYALVRSLSEFAEGKGADNTRQMRLSAYVLAARLGQVVAGRQRAACPG